MSSFTARTLAKGVRVARTQSARQYASKAVEHPPGYVPTAEEFISQRQAVQDHAAGAVTTFSATRIASTVVLICISLFRYHQALEERQVWTRTSGVMGIESIDD